MQEMIPSELPIPEIIPVSVRLVADCRFCTYVQYDPHARTPVHCTKWSGALSPIQVNLNACMTCGEYKK
ncbi:hypothetical protein WMW72_06630 [Paenibacillus filicis]|uniref:Uncharacterized protein n=1 Tax=Paenibacillus filicis TaxID=669464 RepID=A0ABU9DFN8_9BACL